MKNKKILVTAALPYANGPLHFGHIAGAYLPADCYVRYQRLMKQNALYICGSRQFGIAITLSADLAKRTPKEHVDIFHQINKDFFEKLNMSFDHYSRTTWEGHHLAVVLLRDVPDARRVAALDVVVEARDAAVPAGLRALARPVAKDAVEHVERLAHLLRVRVRPEVPDAAPVASRVNITRG